MDIHNAHGDHSHNIVTIQTMVTPVYYTILTLERSYFVDGHAVARLHSAMRSNRVEVQINTLRDSEDAQPKKQIISTTSILAVIRHEGIRTPTRVPRLAEVIPIQRYRDRTFL